MTQQHPITPPKELLKQWEDDWFEEREHADVLLVNAYAAGALAGADAELEACCEWLEQNGWFQAGKELRAARRSKPPSLKEQALDILFDACNDGKLDKATYEKLFHAFEQLFAPS